MARDLGFNVLLCDPPRAAAEGPEKFCSLEYLLENSNVVTMHVPLDETTRGMADETFFALMRPGSIFINAARGEVINEQALIAAECEISEEFYDNFKKTYTGVNV